MQEENAIQEARTESDRKKRAHSGVGTEVRAERGTIGDWCDKVRF